VIQGTPENFYNFVKAEIEKWGPVVRRAGVVAE
jgi:tripartite-type tricarboxylate transporter receptor subunit TctC